MIVRTVVSEKPDVQIVMNWEEMERLFTELDALSQSRDIWGQFFRLREIRTELYKLIHG